MRKDKFFGRMEELGLALSYGDVRLKTGYSEVASAEVDLSSRFSRNIAVNCPLVSSPMDTVTEHKMAIELAKAGGLGVIHRSLTPKDQAAVVARVKFYLNGLIKKPICVSKNDTIKSILAMISEKGYTFRSFPVLDERGKLTGLLTGNDFDFCRDCDLTAGQVMSKDLITAGEDVHLDEVYRKMVENKKKILPLVNDEGDIAGMYVYSDVRRIITGGSLVYNLDANGNLRVGAAVGVGDEAMERIALLVKKGVDFIVIDTAHGDSRLVFNTLKEIVSSYAGLDVVVGNVSEGESAKRLVDAGAAGIKVGQGPGSICTTRMVAGIGRPQVTAIYSCAKAIRGSGVPLCADGGIEFSGDITIAIGAGADTVMLGQFFAGTSEAPGEVIMMHGAPVKVYRGMGSLGAMRESRAARERYAQAQRGEDKLVPEGVEGVVPYKGEVAEIIFQLLGGLRSGMGYVGAANIKELQEKADFDRISGAGLKESHPHGITITEEPPNYRLKR